MTARMHHIVIAGMDTCHRPLMRREVRGSAIGRHLGGRPCAVVFAAVWMVRVALAECDVRGWAAG